MTANAQSSPFRGDGNGDVNRTRRKPMGAQDSKMTILLVEDDAALARGLERHLRRAGFVVTAVGRGVDALAVEGADVGVFDIDLPDISGVDVARRLLESARIGRAIFFTATDDAFSLQEARALGLVIDKSEGVEKLLAALHRHQQQHAKDKS
jgi:DNA-binding response OmpR family regulator